ncbi:DUF1294 domain-containing protein [Clostridium sp. SHJSY1]|nr:DUF1294 domain-containing protein [Clostridium sp. SHJSY1]MDS0524491.1 DUF1294 domain-containing protein [Clostridium sp. SHJSY1]
MLKIIIIYLAIINITSFLVMHIDKQKAIHKKWRISESNLLILSILGGSIGMLLGMSFFRHKTKHKKFTIGVPLILIIQLAITLSLLVK